MGSLRQPHPWLRTTGLVQLPHSVDDTTQDQVWDFPRVIKTPISLVSFLLPVSDKAVITTWITPSPLHILESMKKKKMWKLAERLVLFFHEELILNCPVI